jgi:uncharacterized protein YndB with AHSA1/START domain
VLHATFVIERTFEAAPAQVFAAFADRAAKASWFVGPDHWQAFDYRLDFRVGRSEHLSNKVPGGPTHTFDARYEDIVPAQRIVYTYEMHLDDRRISVSLATLELLPAGAGTKLILTEQDAFLDGADLPIQREQGMGALLDNLEAYLKRTSTAV